MKSIFTVLCLSLSFSSMAQTASCGETLDFGLASVHEAIERNDSAVEKLAELKKAPAGKFCEILQYADAYNRASVAGLEVAVDVFTGAETVCEGKERENARSYKEDVEFPRIFIEATRDRIQALLKNCPK